jgi:hypothetical protein
MPDYECGMTVPVVNCALYIIYIVDVTEYRLS